MEKLTGLVQRWPYLVLALEALVAGGCLLFGLKVVGSRPVTPPVQVLRAPTRPVEAEPGAGRPVSQPIGSGKPSAPRAARVIGLTSNALSRLNSDDLELYRRQWQVLQMLMDGVRTYLEQRVVPRLLSR